MKTGRRKFLMQAVVGSVGVIAVQGKTLNTNPKIDSTNCFSELSKIDGIDLYIDFLSELRLKLIENIFDEIVEASQECSAILRQLELKVIDLKKEVNNKKDGAKVQQLKKLVQIGKEQVKIVNTSSKITKVNHLTLALVNENLKGNVQDLLPEGVNTLSPKASKLINEIVKLIEASIPVQAKLEKAQANFRQNRQSIDNLIKEIKNLLLDARSLIFESENSSDKIKEAQNSLTKAIKLAEKLKETHTRPQTIGYSLVDTLVIALKGIFNWTNTTDINQNNQDKIVKTKYYYKEASIKPHDISIPTDTVNCIGNVLKNTCAIKSPLREIALALIKIISDLSGESREKKKSAVFYTLKFSTFFGILTLSEKCDSDNELLNLSAKIVDCS